MEAILLAGGLGTRLHQITGDKYPKALTNVAGRPFVHYIIHYLYKSGVRHFIFALSHHAQMIIDEVSHSFPELNISFSVEDKPLGTGGAIKKALQHVQGDKSLVLNADSFINFSIEELVNLYNLKKADLCMVATFVEDVSRYGAIKITDNDKIEEFLEKGNSGSGYINSGVYLISKEHKILANSHDKFSFEKDVLANKLNSVYVTKFKGMFFDMGTVNGLDYAERTIKENQEMFF